MTTRPPDDSLNLEDSGTLELGRAITARQTPDSVTEDPPPELSGNRRQGDSKSRELLANPFDASSTA
jgi:hypothetical protein